MVPPISSQISVVSAPPCLELLVKWLRGAGLSASPCRTHSEFEATRSSILILEAGYSFSDRKVEIFDLIERIGFETCILFEANFLTLEAKNSSSTLSVSFVLPQQLGRLLSHLRTLWPLESLGENALLSLGSLLVNPTTREVCTGEGEVELTALQFDLLTILLQEPGRVFSTDELQTRLDRLQTGRRDAGVVRYHIARLRSRLGSSSQLIENVRGCGYRARHTLLR